MQITNAYFEITNQCNLNCITCYNRSGLNTVRSEFSFSDLIQAIERLHSEFGCTSFAFAGGEPLLYSRLDSLLSYLESHSELQASFVTNGTIHNPNFIRFLHSDPSRFHLQISLDGSCEAINHLTRGPGAFARTLRYLDQAASPDFKPLVKMVLSQNNLSDVEAFYHMAVQHGGTPEFAFINRTGNATDHWETKALSAAQKVHVIKCLDRLNQENPGVEAVLPLCSSICPLADSSRPLSILVKTDGTLQPCQLFYDSSYSFGSILADSADALKAGMERIRQLALARKSCDFACDRCPLKTQCGRGCMAAAFYQCGDPLGDDGDCTTRKLEVLDYQVRKELLSKRNSR